MIADHTEDSKRKAKKYHISRAVQKKERHVVKKRADIDEKLHPLSYYMHNKEEMINQAFAAIGKRNLKALLFPEIEHLSVDELKKLCLAQLQQMSERDIALVLKGKRLISSEISPSMAGDKQNDSKKLCFKEEKTILNQDDVGTKELHEENSASITHELLESFKTRSSNLNSEAEKLEACSENITEKQSLEVLELEMRARAIRALLQYYKDSGVNNDFQMSITP